MTGSSPAGDGGGAPAAEAGRLPLLVPRQGQRQGQGRDAHLLPGRQDRWERPPDQAPELGAENVSVWESRPPDRTGHRLPPGRSRAGCAAGLGARSSAPWPTPAAGSLRQGGLAEPTLAAGGTEQNARGLGHSSRTSPACRAGPGPVASLGGALPRQDLKRRGRDVGGGDPPARTGGSTAALLAPPSPPAGGPAAGAGPASGGNPQTRAGSLSWSRVSPAVAGPTWAAAALVRGLLGAGAGIGP